MTRNRVLGGVLWIVTAVGAGYLLSQTVFANKQPIQEAVGEHPRPANTRTSSTLATPVLETPALETPASPASNRTVSPHPPSKEQASGAAPTVESKEPLGAGAWIAVQAPVGEDGQPLFGTVYALEAGSTGENDLDLVAHHPINRPVEEVWIPVPAQTTYDVGFVPNAHGWWLLQRDVLARKESDVGEPLAWTRPTSLATVRVLLPKDLPGDVYQVSAFVGSDTSRPCLTYPGRNDARKWLTHAWSKEGGEFVVCQCLPDDSLTLKMEARLGAMNDPEATQYAVTVAPSPLGKARKATATIEVMGTVQIVGDQQDSPLAMRFIRGNSKAPWKVYGALFLNVMRGIVPVASGTYTLEWRTQTRKDSVDNVVVKSNQSTQVKIDIPGATPWEAPLGTFDALMGGHHGESMIAEGIPIGGVGSGSPAPEDSGPLEEQDPKSLIQVELTGVEHPGDTELGAIDSSAGTPGTRGDRVEMGYGDTSKGTLPTASPQPHKAVAVWTNAMDDSDMPYATEYATVQRGTVWRAKLKPAGYVLVARRKIAPAGTIAIRLMHRSGGPLPRPSDEMDPESGVVYFGVALMVESPRTLGPFVAGEHSFDLYMGRKKISEHKVTVRAGETSVLLVP